MNRLLAGAALLSMVAAGCSPAGQRRHDASTLVISQQREPRSLNPALENGTSSTQWGELIFQYLLVPDPHGALSGDAALSAPTLENGGISRDGLTVTYHLRKGLRFADGAPLTAADCVWSIQAILNPANNVQTRYGYDRIASATAPGPLTLVLHLKEPFSPLTTYVLAPQGFPILPKHLLAASRDFNNVPFDDRPLGSGPYYVTQWKRGDRVELRANPYYWRGKPPIEHLSIRFVPDPNSAIGQLRTGESDALFNNEDLSSYTVMRGVPNTWILSAPVAGVGPIIFNTADPITGDPRVRRALALAIDVPSLVAKAFQGALTSKNAGAGLFTWAYDPRAYPDLPYEPKTSAALLESAGWKIGAQGLRYRDGRPLEVQMAIQAQTPTDQIVGNFVAAAERAIGVRVTLKQYAVEQFVAPADAGGPVYGGKFQLALYGFVNGDDPDTTDQFACSHVPPNGYNKSRFCNARADALLLAGRREYGTSQRDATYRQLQALLYRELPIALLYQNRQISLFSSRLHGPVASPAGTFWNVGSWALSE